MCDALNIAAASDPNIFHQVVSHFIQDNMLLPHNLSHSVKDLYMYTILKQQYLAFDERFINADDTWYVVASTVLYPLDDFIHALASPSISKTDSALAFLIEWAICSRKSPGAKVDYIISLSASFPLRWNIANEEDEGIWPFSGDYDIFADLESNEEKRGILESLMKRRDRIHITITQDLVRDLVCQDRRIALDLLQQHGLLSGVDTWQDGYLAFTSMSRGYVKMLKLVLDINGKLWEDVFFLNTTISSIKPRWTLCIHHIMEYCIFTHDCFEEFIETFPGVPATSHFNQRTVYLAIVSGRIDLLRLMVIDKGLSITPDNGYWYEECVMRGDYEMIRELHHLGYKPSDFTLTRCLSGLKPMARRERIELLRYLIEQVKVPRIVSMRFTDDLILEMLELNRDNIQRVGRTDWIDTKHYHKKLSWHTCLCCNQSCYSCLWHSV